MNTITWLFTYQILKTCKISVDTSYAYEKYGMFHFTLNRNTKLPKFSDSIMLMYSLL